VHEIRWIMIDAEADLGLSNTAFDFDRLYPVYFVTSPPFGYLGTVGRSGSWPAGRGCEPGTSLTFWVPSYPFLWRPGAWWGWRGFFRHAWPRPIWATSCPWRAGPGL